MSLAGALTLLAGLAATALVFTFALIGRFYQRSTGQPTGYRLFALPGALLLLGAAAAFTGPPGLPAAELKAAFWLLGGGVLLALCLRLYQQMTQNSRR
ncbi:MAG: hypothetical protein HY784_09785 [Chloroflexi bacterium]|nr:hypothetical protein [Chloroflexota bacterium]